MEDVAINNTYVEAETVVDPFAKTCLFKNDVATAAAKRRRLKNNVKGWLFSMWPFIGWCIFAGIPFVLSILLSMSELHSFNISQFEFVGFENYKWIFTDPEMEFWYAMRQTLYYCLSLPIGIVLGLGTAVLLTRGLKLTRLFRTILFIPNVCSVVGVSMMWKLVFHQQYGVINSIIMACGAEFPINFLGDPGWFMPCVIFTTTWSAGSGSLLFQAALEQVNKSLIEAAEIDGASRTRIFFRITLPAISPTTFYVLTMNTIGALQSMANIQILAGNSRNPLDAEGHSMSLTAVYLIYWYAFNNPFKYGLGRASACAWVLAIFIFILTRINFKLGDYWVCYDN